MRRPLSVPSRGHFSFPALEWTSTVDRTRSTTGTQGTVAWSTVVSTVGWSYGNIRMKDSPKEDIGSTRWSGVFETH